MISPELEGSGTEVFLIKMGLVNMRELNTMHRERPMLVEEPSLPIRWFGIFEGTSEETL